jgi:hypothetical protein
MTSMLQRVVIRSLACYISSVPLSFHFQGAEAFLRKLKVAQPLEKIAVFYGTGGLITVLTIFPVTGPCPEPDESNQRPHILFL